MSWVAVNTKTGAVTNWWSPSATYCLLIRHPAVRLQGNPFPHRQLRPFQPDGSSWISSFTSATDHAFQPDESSTIDPAFQSVLVNRNELKWTFFGESKSIWNFPRLNCLKFSLLVFTILLIIDSPEHFTIDNSEFSIPNLTRQYERMVLADVFQLYLMAVFRGIQFQCESSKSRDVQFIYELRELQDFSLPPTIISHH